MGARGIIRDVFLLYLGVRLVAVWLFGAKFTVLLGFMVVIMMLSSAWFFLERFGVL